jgi:predicted RNA-binding Zn ribbon-like protein
MDNALIDPANFLAGDLSLDFANMLTGESLDDYGVLLGWSRAAGTLSDAQAARLSAGAEARPGEAAAALAHAAELGDVLRRVMHGLAQDETPAAEDLDRLNDFGGRGLAHRLVLAEGDHFHWGWPEDSDDLERPLWPVAAAAGELLVSGRLDRLDECSSHSCRWLFLDLSKNASRRWCDMKTCGNRAKARRHRHRTAATA